MAVRPADTPYFNSAHGLPCCMLSKRQGGGGENRVFRPRGRAGRKFARILQVGETQDDGESGDSAFFLDGSAEGRAYDAVGRVGGGGGYACNLSGGLCMRESVRIEKKSWPGLGFFPFSAVAFSALRQDVFVLAARRKLFAAKKSRFVRLKTAEKAGEMLLYGNSPARFLTLGFLFHKFYISFLSGKTL